MKKQTMIEIRGGGATRKTGSCCDLTLCHSSAKDNLSPKPLKRSCFEPFYENRYVILNLIQNLSILIKSIRKDSGSEAGMTKISSNNLRPAGQTDNTSRKTAFTMAEVLITLGIIGIVAAMTMPMLLAKYQKQVTIERLKKFYSVMANVINLSESENGEMVYWDFPKDSYDKSMDKFFQRYYLPYMKDARECYSANCFSKEEYTINSLSGQEANGIYLANYIVKTNDGMYIYFLPNIPSGYIWMFVDINAHQKPNQIGRDIFVFDIYGYPGVSNRKNYRLKFWCVNENKIEDLTKISDYGCNKSAGKYSGFCCGELIYRSGWNIPDNYPW